MPDLSAKSGLVYCPNCGNTYDPHKHASCPYCASGKKGGFQPTADPYAQKAKGGFQPTADPNVTKPPKPEDWGPDSGSDDPFDPTIPLADEGTTGKEVVGWLVAVSGPCKGEDFRIHNGYNYIGREEGQIIITGDMNISRRRDSAVLFDEISSQFHIGHVEGQNMLRLNGAPVISTVQMHNYDRISIGKTELVFVGLCGENFTWGKKDG